MDICGIGTTLNDVYVENSNLEPRSNNCTGLATFHLATQAEIATVATVFTCIGIMGLVFNAASIWIMLHGRHMSKATRGTRVQLLNQSAGDLLMAVVCTPLTIVRDLGISWPDTPAVCKTATFIGQSAFEASVAWTVTISVERFVAVYFPIQVRYYRKRHKLVVAAVVWILMGMSNIEYLIYKEIFMFTITTEDNNTRTVRLCVNTVPLASENKALYDVLEGLPYLLFTLTILAMYTSIGVKLLRRKFRDNSKTTSKVASIQ